MRGRRFINLMSTSAVPSWVLSGATVDLDFANGRYFGGTLASLLSITRASNATDLLPSSASGYAYNTFSSNILAISPNVGLLIFEARTNLLLNSNAPVTQTTASLGTGTYTLWGNGAGSSLASGGTATITGAAPATNGSPNTFTVTVAGTVTVTVTGSLNAFQLEAGAFGTSFIVTAGATATRAADSIQAAGTLATTLLGAQGTVLFSGTALGVNAGTNYLLGPGANNGFLMAASNLSGASGGSALQGVANLCVAGGGFTANVPHKMIGSWLQSNYGLSLDGTAVVTSINASTLTQAGPESIGNRLGAQFFNGRLPRLTAWNTQLSNALLPGLST